MRSKLNQSGNIVPIILVVVVLAVVAGVGYKVMQEQDKDNVATTSTSTAAPSTSTKAADLRSSLVSLGVQHMNLTAQAVDSALDGNADAAEYGKALYANGDQIGAAVGSVYGKDAETTFNTVWKIHLDEFVNYAVAGKKGDAAGKTAALSAIETKYTKPLSAYLAKANPNLPEATLNQVLGEHVSMTAKMIDAHNAGNYAAETEQLVAANKHIEGIFSTLAGAIVKQYPDKF